jgi:hypothetical protein
LALALVLGVVVLMTLDRRRSLLVLPLTCCWWLVLLTQVGGMGLFVLTGKEQ